MPAASGRKTLDRPAKRRRKPRSRGRKDDRAVAAFVGDLPARRFAWPFDPILASKFLIGLLLLPLCWVTLETFFLVFGQAAKQGQFWRAAEFWFFGIGVTMWLVLFFGARSRFMLLTYVAGHEWTHALFVLICRGNVAKVHISADGGHILTNRNNFLISLSPYFFPFYTAIVIALWWLAEWLFFDFQPDHFRYLFWVIGFTWCFHLTFTIWMATRKDQPDLDHNGRLFSFSLIALVNTLIIVSLLIFASPTVSWKSFSLTWYANLTTFGARLGESVKEIVGFFV